MADFDDELDINVRDSDDIGARIVLLTALSVWPEITDGSERRTWQDWLDGEALMSVATRLERDTLSAPVGDETSADLCERALDSMAALAWATALTDAVSLTGSSEVRDDLADRIPMPNERIDPFLDQLVLRDEDEIALERERAEIWNWRLASEAIRRASRGADLDEVENAIREVVLESAVSFAIDEVDAVDFLVDSVPVRHLGDEQLDALLVTSEERLRALNWVCGLTEWGVVHLPE